ncbi:hypothetical protein [Halorubrum amylolyticum]|nr:hypothetical protein [Halorubrum amylolyticum]
METVEDPGGMGLNNVVVYGKIAAEPAADKLKHRAAGAEADD